MKRELIGVLICVFSTRAQAQPLVPLDAGRSVNVSIDAGVPGTAASAAPAFPPADAGRATADGGVHPAVEFLDQAETLLDEAEEFSDSTRAFQEDAFAAEQDADSALLPEERNSAIDRARTAAADSVQASQRVRDTVAMSRSSVAKGREQLRKLRSVDLSARALRLETTARTLESDADERARLAMQAASSAGVKKNRRWKDAWFYALRSRCATAVCWGGPDGVSRGIEPLVELPLGLSWAVGDGALSDFINSSEFRVEFTAGLRIWFRDDFVSVAIYFAKPIFTGDSRIRPLGSELSYPTSAVRRVYPSIALGLLGDLVFIGMGVDELRNPTSLRDSDPRFSAGEVVSRALTFTLGLAPFTGIRNGLGALGRSRTEAKQ